MKKVVLISFMFVGLLCGDDCRREKEEYRQALECYKSHLGEGFSICMGSKYLIGKADTLEKARKWVELAKMDLDMCLLDKNK